MIKKARHFVFLLVCGLLSTSLYAEDGSLPSGLDDPYESFNRVVFSFNESLDRFVLKPVAEAYNVVIPKPLASRFTNFFSNLDNITTIINDLLQVNLYQAISDSWRFVINSTAGLLGFFDVSSMIGLELNTEDFGLTLAQWGYKESHYLVLPFIGPSTLRDALAWPVNYQFFTILPYLKPAAVRYDLYGASTVIKRADILNYESVFQQAMLDKYVFIRNAYLQRRAYLIERNKQLNDPYLEPSSISKVNPTP